MTTVLKTLRMALRDLPGGIAKAARDADLSESTLYNKLNDECPSHHLYFHEFRELAHPERCKSAAPIQQLCNDFGGVFVNTSISSDSPARELTNKLAVIAKEFSEFLGEVSASAADDRIKDDELARAKKEFYELAAVGAETIAKMEAMNASYHEGMRVMGAEAEAAAKAARRAMAGIGK